MDRTEPAFRVGASIWGFFHRRPPEDWPTLAEAVEAISAMDNALGVEVWASRALEEPATAGDPLARLVEACGKTGFVSVHVRGMFWSWDPEKLRREIDFVQAVGGRTLVLHPVCLGLKRPGDRIDIDEVRRIADHAREGGVRLALENVRDSVWMLDHVLDALGADPKISNLGVCIDVGHAHLSKDAVGPDAVSAYLWRYRDALIHLHLHDNHGQRDEHLAFGDGTISWPQTLGTLREIGFAGTAILEIHGSENRPDEAIRRSIATLRLLG